MPRLDRTLAHLFDGRDGAEQCRLKPRDDGDDRALGSLRIANVSSAIAGGDLAGAWELGVAVIREVLRSGR